MLMYLLGVLFVVVGVGVSIALHEIGHLAPAKAFGVKCSQYMIGFGPTIWSRRRGETEYGIKAIPLGGYVRMLGMFPPRSVAADRSISTGLPAGELDGSGDGSGSLAGSGDRVPERSGRWSAMIEDARRQSMAEVGPGDGDRVFYKLSTPKKIVVMLGGPAMNLLLATLIFGGLVLFHGVAVAQPGAQVSQVVQCVRPAATQVTAPRQACTADDAPSPAAAAGLRPGDRFVSIDGRPVNSTTDITTLVRPHVGRALPVVVERDGRQLTLSITPIANTVPQLDAAGQVVQAPDGSIATTTAGFIGASSMPPVVMERSLSHVPTVVWTSIERTGAIILQLPQRMVDVWNAAFGPAERDIDGPISVVGVGRVAGEVTSGQIDDPLTQAALTTQDKAVMLWTMLGGLNIALFVFNLIPLLPLDGGHIAGAIWEAIKRGFARLLRRPDPGYVDVAKGLPIAYAMSLLLITMSALLIYADFVKPVRL